MTATSSPTARAARLYPHGETRVRMPAVHSDAAWEHEGRSGKTPGERHAFYHGDGSITWHQVEYATREQVDELRRRYLAKQAAEAAAQA